MLTPEVYLAKMSASLALFGDSHNLFNMSYGNFALTTTKYHTYLTFLHNSSFCLLLRGFIFTKKASTFAFGEERGGNFFIVSGYKAPFRSGPIDPWQNGDGCCIRALINRFSPLAKLLAKMAGWLVEKENGKP